MRQILCRIGQLELEIRRAEIEYPYPNSVRELSDLLRRRDHKIAQKSQIRLEQRRSAGLPLDLLQKVAGRLDDLNSRTMAACPSIIAGPTEPIPFQIYGGW